jgi:hypothetical protein
MILEASDSIYNYVQQCIALRLNYIGVKAEEIKPPPLLPTMLLSQLQGYERLYHKFTDANTTHKLRGVIRQCYKYAHRAAAADPKLIYCEGLATNINVFGIPLEHAWCVHEDTGEVWDPVWKNKHLGIGYCGVPLHPLFINKCLSVTSTYGILGTIWAYKDLLHNQLQDVIHPAYRSIIK